MKSELWDTSALIALQHQSDKFHPAAMALFDGELSAAQSRRILCCAHRASADSSGNCGRYVGIFGRGSDVG
jgi:hypothetical protein